MAHGMYHYIREAWKNPDNATLKSRMIEWRRSDAAEVVDKPCDLIGQGLWAIRQKEGLLWCALDF